MSGSQILRIAASEVSVVANYHPYTSAASVLMKYVYQDAEDILENDCAAIGIELETPEQTVQQILLQLPVETSTALSTIQRNAAHITSLTQASSDLAALNTLLASPSISTLSIDHQLFLRNEVQHSIATSFGHNAEAMVYDQYLASTGYAIHNRNNELLVLPIHAETHVSYAATNSYVQDAATLTTSIANTKQQRVDVSKMYQCLLVDLYGIPADRLPVVKINMDTSLKVQMPFAYWYDRHVRSESEEVSDDVRETVLQLVENVTIRSMSSFRDNSNTQPASKRSKLSSTSSVLRMCHVVLPYIDDCSDGAIAALARLCEQHQLHYFISSTHNAVVWKIVSTTDSTTIGRYYILPPELYSSIPPFVGFPQFYIVGYIDGLSTQINMNTYENENIVIEIKNRISAFRPTCNIYDIIQLVTYCKMANASSSDLVECYDDKINITRIDSTSMHFQNWDSAVLPNVVNFVKIVYKIRSDVMLRYQLLLCIDDVDKLEEFFKNVMISII